MNLMPKNAKNADILYCNHCDFKCSKESNWHKHTLTRKHQYRTKLNSLEQKNAKKCQDFFECKCGKRYNARNSLWYHKQKCNITNKYDEQLETINDDTSVNTGPKDNTIIMLVQQNQEFKDLLVQQHTQLMAQNSTIMEMSKNSNQIITQNHTNSHNKTFNLQFFLNETCKDAMNLTDFVQSLQLNLIDLEKMGEVGFAEGLSRMFVKGLNELEVTKRPIHCTDVKREILHIKNEGKWEKERADQKQIKQAIKQIENKNITQLDDWRAANPGCTEWNHKQNGKYLKMQYEAMGSGSDEQELKDYRKIIGRVAKVTHIDKNSCV